MALLDRLSKLVSFAIKLNVLFQFLHLSLKLNKAQMLGWLISLKHSGNPISFYNLKQDMTSVSMVTFPIMSASSH